MDGPPSNPDQPGFPSTSLLDPNARDPADPSRKTRRRSFLDPHWRDPYGRARLPTFGQWIKLTWPDLLTLLLVGAAAFPTYYFAPPFTTPSFPIYDPSVPGSTPNLPQYSYPARRQTVSNWLIAIVAIAAPVLTMLLFQAVWLRSFWDLHNGLLGFAYALVLSSAFQATVKALIGGLRPNFYDVCRPDTTSHARGGLNGVGPHGDMWTRDVCTNTAKGGGALRNAMQSFPSGHSTTTWAAAVFLALYLNAKLKVFADRHTPGWKLVVVILPLLAGTLLVGTLIVDNTHSWWDVLAGSLIGALVATAAFRTVYAGLFDWRVNHVPLCRNVSFQRRGYGGGEGGRDGQDEPRKEEEDVSRTGPRDGGSVVVVREDGGL
ncbi:PAP2 superfamily-domain-containing protein [Xylariaceae sp. FL0594]|nr:PAP2 superfamily-domain-containing protein [Xylariaceae sp. FL0594]